MESHVPVLLDEVLRYLAVQPGGCYVDATFGRGGHSRAILESLGPAGRLLALDRDPAAIAAARALASREPRLLVRQLPFGELAEAVHDAGMAGRCAGILLDLGVSSPQFDDPTRGFSFQADGPLDMRMDPTSGESAADWLNRADEREIASVLWRFGEEREARRIARAICTDRQSQPIATTRQLAELVARIVRREPGRHPATRTFQAIRIRINGELDQLAAALDAVPGALARGGRLCVISFHSLEDRYVKRFLRDRSRVDPALADLPSVPAAALPILALPTRAVKPGPDEIERNPRARSAVLRVAERIR